MKKQMLKMLMIIVILFTGTGKMYGQFPDVLPNYVVPSTFKGNLLLGKMQRLRHNSLSPNLSASIWDRSSLYASLDSNFKKTHRDCAQF